MRRDQRPLGSTGYSSTVNRSPRWLLPTVLTALVLAVIIGAALT
jgi:hypothetical protein